MVRDRVMRRREDLRGDVAGGAEDLHPLLRRALLHPLQNPVAHLFERLRRPPRRPALPLLLGEQLGQVRRVHEGVEEVLEQVAQLNPASVRGHHRVIVQRRHAAAEVEDRGIDIRPPLVQLGQQQLDEVERQHPLQQRRLDDLPAPAAIALDQRRDDSVHRALRRRMPAHRDRGESRPLAHPLPREALHPPRLRRDQPLIRRVFRVRPARPEAGDRTVDQPRIGRRQRAIVGPQALDRGGSERRHDHIRRGAELDQPRPTIRGREVRLDAALAAQPHRRRRQRAQRIAPGPLQLQHLSAKVAQDHRRDAADRPARKVQYPNPVQHRSHRHPPMPKLPSEYMGRPRRLRVAARVRSREGSQRLAAGRTIRGGELVSGGELPLSGEGAPGGPPLPAASPPAERGERGNGDYAQVSLWGEFETTLTLQGFQIMGLDPALLDEVQLSAEWHRSQH